MIDVFEKINDLRVTISKFSRFINKLFSFSIKFLAYFAYVDTTTTILTYIFFEARKLGNRIKSAPSTIKFIFQCTQSKNVSRHCHIFNHWNT